MTVYFEHGYLREWVDGASNERANGEAGSGSSWRRGGQSRVSERRSVSLIVKRPSNRSVDTGRVVESAESRIARPGSSPVTPAPAPELSGRKRQVRALTPLTSRGAASVPLMKTDRRRGFSRSLRMRPAAPKHVR